MRNNEVLKGLFTPKKWNKLFKVFSRKEKIIFLALLVLFLGDASFISARFYLQHTKIEPANGGTLVEGVVGQPQFINPLYLSSNDPDKDLSELVFSGITKYDQNGNIVYDLAKDIQVENGGTAYKVFLKDNVYWSDSTPNNPQKLTADDVIFTIQTIQNSKDVPMNVKANWTGVDVEKEGDYEILFTLKNPYTPFLENLTLGIIPKHIFQNIPNFTLSNFMLNPVGSGPYEFESLAKTNSGYVNSITLKKNPNYYGSSTYISKIQFDFYKTQSELTAAAKAGKIDGLFSDASENGNVAPSPSFNTYDFSLPSYFGVFFNPTNSKILSDSNIRQALNYGTNKEEIIKDALNSQAKVVDSPILPSIFGFSQPTTTYSYDPQKANSLLDAAGFTQKNASGTREEVIQKQPAFQFTSTLKVGSTGPQVSALQTCLAQFPDIYPSGQVTGNFGNLTKAAVINFQEKYANEILKPYGLTKGTGAVYASTRKELNAICEPTSQETTPLVINLVTINQPEMVRVANALKSQWQQIGVDLEIQTIDDISTLENNYIKPRNYDAILFGEALGTIPDPFPFWDSTQAQDPGLNLAVYKNPNADKLLEDARQTSDPQQRQADLENFQNILINDAPAVLLYSPNYVYFVSNKIKNINGGLIVDPSQRFLGVENWYINTKRGWK